MLQRGLICLAILLSLCVSVVAFLPVGAGPYTAIYGPASALRAQRALLLLVLAIGFTSLEFEVLFAIGSFGSPCAADGRRFAPGLCSDPALSISLRC